MIQVTIILLVICSNILTISLINYIVNKKVSSRFNVGEEPSGLYIVKAALFVCAGLVLSEIGTALKEVSQVYSIGNSPSNAWVGILTYYAAFFSITGLVIFIASWFSVMVFAVFTKGKNIFGDALADNTNYSVLFVGIILSIFLSIKPGVSALLMYLIQYPVSPVFH